MKKYLIALPVFPGKVTNWNHQTILVSAKNEADAIATVRHLKGNHVHIGRIEEQKETYPLT